MSFSSNVKEELLGLKMWDMNSQMKQEEQIARLCVREAFIKSGSISDPNKKYHLQILFKDENKAKELQQVLENFNIKAKIIRKGKDYMLYIKEGEEISNFLALIGANASVIKFEEIRVIREARNSINRLVNCETANLNKTINAAATQIEDIKTIKKENKFKGLSDNLKEIANLRLENPDATLEELANMLKKPISKSGVNHRLKKISQIAAEIRSR